MCAPIREQCQSIDELIFPSLLRLYVNEPSRGTAREFLYQIIANEVNLILPYTGTFSSASSRKCCPFRNSVPLPTITEQKPPRDRPTPGRLIVVIQFGERNRLSGTASAALSFHFFYVFFVGIECSFRGVSLMNDLDLPTFALLCNLVLLFLKLSLKVFS